MNEYILDLKKIWNIFKKDWKKYAAIVLACTISLFIASSFLISKSYSSTASVIVVTNNNQTYSDVQLSQKLTSTYGRIVTSDTVAEKVISRLSLNMTADRFKEIVKTNYADNTEILDIVVTTNDPQLSANIANTTVDVFTQQIYTMMNVENVTLLDNAKVPKQPSSPNVKKYTAVGFALGVLISAMIVVIKSILNSKVITEEDVKRVLYYPVIGLIPDLETPPLAISNESDSVIAESFRTLRTNIEMHEFDKQIKMINVISSNSEEGKTTAALNLAYSYSQLGKKVLLIDMDLRLPSVHKKLGIKNGKGLTDLIVGKGTLKSCIYKGIKEFDILLSGTKTPYPTELIQSEALKEFLKKIREEYDLIIIDCPPVNLVADGIIISAYCDGTLLCVASNKDDEKDLVKAKQTLEHVKANVIGTVMTFMPEGGKYYKYNYGHSNSEKKKITLPKLRLKR